MEKLFVARSLQRLARKSACIENHKEYTKYVVHKMEPSDEWDNVWSRVGNIDKKTVMPEVTLKYDGKKNDRDIESVCEENVCKEIVLKRGRETVVDTVFYLIHGKLPKKIIQKHKDISTKKSFRDPNAEIFVEMSFSMKWTLTEEGRNFCVKWLLTEEGKRSWKIPLKEKVTWKKLTLIVRWKINSAAARRAMINSYTNRTSGDHSDSAKLTGILEINTQSIRPGNLHASILDQIYDSMDAESRQNIKKHEFRNRKMQIKIGTREVDTEALNSNPNFFLQGLDNTVVLNAEINVAKKNSSRNDNQISRKDINEHDKKVKYLSQKKGKDVDPCSP